MKMLILCVSDRIAEQIGELGDHYGRNEQEVVLDAIQRDYIHVFDYKRSSAEEALYASWLESQEFDDPFEDELPI